MKKFNERSRKELEEEMKVLENKVAALMEGKKIEKKAEQKENKEKKMEQVFREQREK